MQCGAKMSETPNQPKQLDVGLFSIGLSCQTAHQLRTARSKLAEVGIECDSVPSGYFDWLICPPKSATRLIADGIPEFKPGDIVLRNQPCWADYEFYFWHDFRQDEEIDIEQHFERSLGKFNHLRHRFQEMDRYRRIVFVLSNSQNNLIEVQQDTGALDYMLDDGKVMELKIELEKFLSRKVELLVLTYKDRFAGEKVGDYWLEYLEPDTSEWKGDSKVWQDCLRRYFSRSTISG